jgi:DNA-directed RNA polymerase specialized sigma24 family protein
VQLEIRGAERLSFREKQAVILKETGFSSEEIAHQLGINTTTVATLLSRARAKGYQAVIIVPTNLGLFGGDADEPGAQ